MPRFRPHEHIRKPGDFQLAYERRRSAADGQMIVYVRENGFAYARVGLSVSKKFGNAVRRNRLRRLLREAFRLSKHELPAGYDYVLIPRMLEQYEQLALQKSLVKMGKAAVKKLLREVVVPPENPV